MNSQHAHQAQPAASLPVLSSYTVRRFRRTPPSFDLMLRRLQHIDPVATRWLYGAAEAIAPGDVYEKERYAALALSLYYMLNEQSFVDEFCDLCNRPAVIPGETVAANNLQEEL